MGAPKPSPLVLVVSTNAELRAWCRAALETDYAVLEKDPRKLGDLSAAIDAAALVFGFGAESDAASFAALKPLERLSARRSLVLVADAAPEAEIARALEQLAPAQVVERRSAPLVLRYAVRQAIGNATPGQGARFNHRPATALLGVSSAIREVIDQIRQIAPTQIPALILGETGTGKELVARAIHEQSPRAAQPFVAINCGALPDSLLESELFGHRKGAFTGAGSDKVGLFEHASGGTIFLDEIGDTSPALQMKLLRVIENREIRRLGDTRTIRVDARLVSATHRDLEASIGAGSFRQDLFYRLNAVTIHVPPLRRRRVDIPFLAQHFAEEFGELHARRITLAEDLLESLSQRDFPGNVRELRNAVERAIALAAPSSLITRAHLEAEHDGSETTGFDLGGPLKELTDRVEAAAIRAALARSGGRLNPAARELGLTRPGLSYKIRRLGISVETDSE